jgi:hypothetical protein
MRIQLAAALAALAFLAAPAVHANPPGADQYDFIDDAWVNGHERQIFGSFSQAPASDVDVDCYVAGPVNADDPLDGVTLDPHFPYVHDHVVPKVNYNKRAHVHFMVLRPGPNASAANLRTRTVVQNPDFPPIENEDGSFPITPTLEMPYAVNLGYGFENLVDIDTVHDAIDAGILRTVEVARELYIVGWTGQPVHD